MIPPMLNALMQQVRANPAQMLQRAGYNVPQGMNDPGNIIDHLTQSGQLDQNRLNQLQQMAPQMAAQFGGMPPIRR